ncbi:putative sugar O-methyltransferase [Endozoicomonas elysicola]|uniref:putative sugar O-methyltransferase n=1 Tax=Endozoicomonas elysicola TaxID=305900 RepID=UPI00036373E3|nr:putative sugar O-methyltransferase [Endozoicomonas elysicola]
MIEKIKKMISDPLYAQYVWRRIYLKLLGTEKVFAHKSEFRSDSENGEYGAAVMKALESQKYFDNFKRNPEYQAILEHVNRDDGEKYLNITLSRNDGLFDLALKTSCRADDVGNPIKYKYPDIAEALSPNTLRYIKVSSDLSGLFGREFKSIAEIGCGYGGQALVNDQLLSVNLATLFDLPFVNELIKKYLNSMLLNGAYRVRAINESCPEPYDLVISNYAFSELPSILQRTYIKKVMAGAKRGYLTMNSGLGGERSEGKLTLKQLEELLPPFEIFEEEPLTAPHNYIIVWGHNGDFASKYMKQKKLD